jgi:hypothetical protein
MSDANEEARRTARLAWFEFEKTFPFRKDRLFELLDFQVKKAIEDDFLKGIANETLTCERNQGTKKHGRIQSDYSDGIPS